MPPKLDGSINDMIFGELGIVPGSFRISSVSFFRCRVSAVLVPSSANSGIQLSARGGIL